MDYNHDSIYDRSSLSEKRGDHRVFKTVVLCLVCIILAGAFGLAVGLSYNGWRDASLVRTDPVSRQSDTGSASPGMRLDSETKLPSGERDGLSASDIYQANVNSCVGISTPYTTTNIFGQTSSAAIMGSGFIISSDGYIVTNYHLIQKAVKNDYDVYVMLYNGEKYTAEIVCGDEECDVAMLKIDAEDLKAVTLGDFSSTAVGETVYAIGNPLGELTYTMTEGIVSALRRSILIDANTTITMFQTDTAINLGNSGGPVFNSAGEVIGIVSAKYSSAGVEGLGFAIPINDAMAILDDLRQYGYVKGRPYFGIMVADADYFTDTYGAYVDSVEEGSCSEAAGMQAGDVIISLEDTDIYSRDDLLIAKKKYSAGDTVIVTVLRGNERIELFVTLDELLPTEPEPEPEPDSGSKGYSSFGKSDD